MAKGQKVKDKKTQIDNIKQAVAAQEVIMSDLLEQLATAEQEYVALRADDEDVEGTEGSLPLVVEPLPKGTGDVG
jgi:hypothetical protein